MTVHSEKEEPKIEDVKEALKISICQKRLNGSRRNKSEETARDKVEETLFKKNFLRS